MKFSDILNEDDNDRLYKKADTIYKALKTGIVTIKNRENVDVIKFKYVLPELYTTNIINRLGQPTPEITVDVLSYRVIDGDKFPEFMSHHLTVLFNLIQQKFRKFGVSLTTDSFIMDFKDLDDEELNESIVTKHEDWDDEAKRVKKKVYTILKAHQRGVITIPGLNETKKFRYEFIDTLLGDIKGLGMTLAFTSTLDRDTNHLILHPKLNLRDVYVKIWDENGKQIDVTSFEFDGTDKSLVLHKIGDRLRAFDIKINWGWTKSSRKWD
jgi:hypothetical protein